MIRVNKSSDHKILHYDSRGMNYIEIQENTVSIIPINRADFQKGGDTPLSLAVNFPRGEVLVGILNALNVSSDLVFCDVVGASLKQRSCLLYDMIQCLPSREQVKILEVVDLLTKLLC